MTAITRDPLSMDFTDRLNMIRKEPEVLAAYTTFPGIKSITVNVELIFLPRNFACCS